MIHARGHLGRLGNTSGSPQTEITLRWFGANEPPRQPAGLLTEPPSFGEPYARAVEGDRQFTAALEIIDGNPFVVLPAAVLNAVFDEAGRSKGPIPVRGRINDRPYQQTLVKFRGAWRLYVNMKMLDDSPRRIGETLEVAVSFDPSNRGIEPHPKLLAMLDANPAAKDVFDAMAPSKQNEIVRYIDSLKTEKSIDRNVGRALDFLLGKGRFVGRDRP